MSYYSLCLSCYLNNARRQGSGSRPSTPGLSLTRFFVSISELLLAVSGRLEWYSSCACGCICVLVHFYLSCYSEMHISGRELYSLTRKSHTKTSWPRLCSIDRSTRNNLLVSFFKLREKQEHKLHKSREVSKERQKPFQTRQKPFRRRQKPFWTIHKPLKTRQKSFQE